MNERNANGWSWLAKTGDGDKTGTATLRLGRHVHTFELQTIDDFLVLVSLIEKAFYAGAETADLDIKTRIDAMDTYIPAFSWDVIVERCHRGIK